MTKYWESESPIEARSKSNVLRFYKNAGFLQVSRPDYQTEAGETRPGKSVALNLNALRDSPDKENVREILREIWNGLDG